jgi:WD40 repeat protein
MNAGRFLLLACVALGLGGAFAAQAQTAPQVVWSAPTPSGLANSLVGIDWAPGTTARIALGSSDRWVRLREAGNGALVYSVLQPLHAGTADQTLYSTDGAFIAVHDSGLGLGYRVLRAGNGAFLGMLSVTLDPNGLVRFAPDAQLLAATGGDGTLSRWRLANFTVVRVVGSGYDRVTTTFRISPDATLQVAASQGSITVQRRSDGAVVRVLIGGATRGTTPLAFSPDSTRLAAWASTPDETTLWRLADGVVVMRFPNATSQEGVVALRFSPGGARLVTTGYQPFVDADGLWQQKGIVRFWRVSDGALRHTFDARTGIGVTSPIAWSPDMTRFAYGTYEGTAVVAVTPAP